MLTELKRNGEYLGIHPDHLLVVVNGQKVRLFDQHQAEITDEFVEIYDNFIDGDKINRDVNNLLKYRQTLSTDGIVSVTVCVDKQNKKVTQAPIFIIRGSFHTFNSNDLINKITRSISENLEELMRKSETVVSDNDIKTAVASTVDFYI
jgi:mRNA degradation ribonuclease J1/J2